MNLEHIAYNVHDPLAMARWYVDHLDMKIVMQRETPNPVAFIADQRGMMIEIYRNPTVPLLDNRAILPLTMHLAFYCDDMVGQRARLMAAGATAEGEITGSAGETQVAMLRDPWGLVVQLIRRPEPLRA